MTSRGDRLVLIFFLAPRTNATIRINTRTRLKVTMGFRCPTVPLLVSVTYQFGLVSAMCCDHVLLSCLTTYQLVAGVCMISASVQPTHQLAIQPTSVSDASGLTTIVAHLHRNNDRITSANAAGHRTACVGMNSFTTSAAKC